ncbi:MULTISPECIES: DUF4136 domain-containing protein [Spirosoma]|uniref:DUF4136 domain-containing protein n=1 Tax=Spirosoma sordidisoli TaxID=2502893 RepID=A0A4Q2UFX3_9BACT|nr:MULTISPECIES: DUF4136 domain-containing protein [Spirosoma]RYC66265.1 DUF4136 domain-containing protein [Spirosoma sordidisoli]
MKRIMLVAVLLTAMIGCAPRVTVDSNSRVNFSKYRTYAWMDSDIKAGENPLYYNQLATESVENTLSRVLSEKGLKPVRSRPDLLVGYHFFVEDKTRTVAAPTSPFYGPYLGWGRWGYGGWGPGWWGWGGQQYTQEQYQAGTVVVDMVDTRTRQLVWRGSVQNAIGDPARIAAQLTKEVERIAEKFPERKS